MSGNNIKTPINRVKTLLLGLFFACDTRIIFGSFYISGIANNYKTMQNTLFEKRKYYINSKAEEEAKKLCSIIKII